MVTVLSPWLHLGSSARLIAGVSFGCTPLTNQYSGRNIWYWNANAVYTELLAPGMTGRIQFGVAPGGSPPVRAPAGGVPFGAAAEPNAPDGPATVEPLPPVLLLLPQAART